MLRVAVLALDVLGQYHLGLIAADGAHDARVGIFTPPARISAVHIVIAVIAEGADIGIAAHPALPQAAQQLQAAQIAIAGHVHHLHGHTALTGIGGQRAAKPQ